MGERRDGGTGERGNDGTMERAMEALRTPEGLFEAPGELTGAVAKMVELLPLLCIQQGQVAREAQ